MDLSLKLVLEEIQKSKEEFGHRFVNLESARSTLDVATEKRLVALESGHTVLDPTVECRLSELESLHLEPIQSEQDLCVSALGAAITDLGNWRPETEVVVDDLRLEVSKLSKH
ncbi:unnamed protein product [Miscanthus lutarioriparius]|uniref:Uncharacterized protein n=1 Tax=Miscanthus lutarioriparius TaxID=422564 RepID=A0A811SRK4_9POAL|nr:unnamed protein product [Miscanthus lutarioriparius]